MAVSKKCIIGVIIFCLLGILIGSVADFQINVALANKTVIGNLFATYGCYFSYCLYPAAGVCLYKGIIKKGEQYKMLATLMLAIAYFMAVYYTNNYAGSKFKALLGYTAGKSSAWFSVLGYLIIVISFVWVPLVCMKIIDDENAIKLIAVGAVILIAGFISDNVNLWLKQVASRPRFKYLITLKDPLSEFRQWWQMVPYLAGSNDNFKSWPSGNMTIACMMFALPTLADVTKNRSNAKNTVCFVIACLFVILYGYNRIHMTNHFLSDVCFGTLITYLIFLILSKSFEKLWK